jgi:hypothetical protein
MPLDPTATTHIALALAPGSAPRARAASAHAAPAAAVDSPAGPIDDEPGLDEGSPWNYVIGSVLAAGGIALATIDPIRTSTRDGECADTDCNRVYRFGTESLLKVVAGGVLLAGGAVVLLLQPLRVEAELSGESAAVRVRGSF